MMVRLLMQAKGQKGDAPPASSTYQGGQKGFYGPASNNGSHCSNAGKKDWGVAKCTPGGPYGQKGSYGQKNYGNSRQNWNQESWQNSPGNQNQSQHWNQSHSQWGSNNQSQRQPYSDSADVGIHRIAAPSHIDLVIKNRKLEGLGFDYAIEEADELERPVVKAVTAGSDAAKKGLLIGMKIVRLNGLDLSMFSGGQMRELLEDKKKDGLSIRFK